EKRIKTLARRPGRESADDADIQSVAEELSTTFLPYEDWELLYRELLQVLVKRRGGSHLLRHSQGGASSPPPPRGGTRRRLHRTVRTAGSFGRRKLQTAAADRSAD